MRRALALLALAALTACSSSDHEASVAPGATTPPPTAAPSEHASTAANPTTNTSAAPGSSSTAGAGGSPTTPAGGAPHASARAAAASKATAPGNYTYDSTGSQTISGGKQAINDTSTLTVSEVIEGSQTSTLHNSQGDTEQDLVVRSTGSFLATLTISSPGVNKEFRFSPPALLFPDPAKLGARWSWHSTSTDGSTTVNADNKLVRTETLTIGGQRVTTVVLQTHLVITGKDVHYTADATNWVAPAYRLPVKTHTVGSGSYGVLQFSFDVTDVLRSVHPA